MDLANMRSLGVSAVDVYCACGHQATIDVSALPDGLAVPAIKNRLRCSKCGKRPNETRPDWSQYRANGLSGAVANSSVAAAEVPDFLEVVPDFLGLSCQIGCDQLKAGHIIWKKGRLQDARA
jgi:hypothetical protein